ncbi:MAG: STELLO glycosyltransferase family protein [Pseudomonadota bacterium]|nr:STELLO glycosyltransferase family protein [Pseudomonadota bacterium]
MSKVVITTIQAPTESVMAMLGRARGEGFDVIAIGDRKTPEVPWPEGASYYNVQQQLDAGFDLAKLLPLNHYARKNIGYLIAMMQGAPAIFDTDDDNAPLGAWHARSESSMARACQQTGWVNVYRWFSDAHVWPRGLPLDHVRHRDVVAELGPATEVRAPIQQGLADGSPDVDAVWRLLMDQDIRFRNSDSVLLPEGAWCPFNSQSTWWFPAAYSLMYLPSFVSFRMTDIWRSFVAQRCLWAMDLGLVFHGPEMFQDRNPHNLMRDFEQEVPGYLGNEKIRLLLEGAKLQSGLAAAGDNCHRCYEVLVAAGVIPASEIPLLEAWLGDTQRIMRQADRIAAPAKRVEKD